MAIAVVSVETTQTYIAALIYRKKKILSVWYAVQWLYNNTHEHEDANSIFCKIQIFYK